MIRKKTFNINVLIAATPQSKTFNEMNRISIDARNISRFNELNLN